MDGALVHGGICGQRSVRHSVPCRDLPVPRQQTMFCPRRQGHDAQLFRPERPTRATLAEMAGPAAGAGLERMLCHATDLNACSQAWPGRCRPRKHPSHSWTWLGCPLGVATDPTYRFDDGELACQHHGDRCAPQGHPRWQSNYRLSINDQTPVPRLAELSRLPPMVGAEVDVALAAADTGC